MKIRLLANAALITVFLGGCASPAAYYEHQKAQAELDRFVRAPYFADVDLVAPGQLTKDQQDADVTARAPQLKPCIDSVETGLLGMRLARSTLDLLHRGNDIDKAFDACARTVGLTGRINFKVGEEYLTFSEYIAQGTRAAEVASAAKEKVSASEQSNALAFAYGLSMRPLVPTPVYVAPHVRHDGSFVRGHVRTAPDGNCLNNLGGCR